MISKRISGIMGEQQAQKMKYSQFYMNNMFIRYRIPGKTEISILPYLTIGNIKLVCN